MTLSYKATSGKEASVRACILVCLFSLLIWMPQVSIPFNPPLLGYEEVKPRLIQMKIQAEEGIGMASIAIKLDVYPH